jgi:hypothetical protein
MSTQQASKERHVFQSFLLIVIETLLTFLLKHDRMSRLQAQQLIQRRAVICFKTHLPSDTFYVTFAPQGVLFDYEIIKDTKIDATVTASTPDLLRAFFTASPQIMEKIRISGDPLLGQELHQLMELFNIPQILSDWRHWLDFKSRDVTPINQRMKPLLRRIDQQRVEIGNMQLNAKEQAYQLRKYKRRFHLLIASSLIVILSLISTIIYMYWYFN